MLLGTIRRDSGRIKSKSDASSPCAVENFRKLILREFTAALSGYCTRHVSAARYASRFVKHALITSSQRR